MAIDKAIDSTQLDSDLTSVANAIRTKGGTSAQLAFPAGFVSEIENIPSGGNQTWYASPGNLYQANMEIPSSVTLVRYVREAYNGATHLVSYIQDHGSVNLDSDYGLFRRCTALKTVWVARSTFGSYCFDGCRALENITLGRVGLAVTSVTSGIFNASSMTNIQTITVYVNASDLEGVPSAVKDRIVPSHSSGAVITYRNYNSGDVIATVTVP